jgi:hypothetical protein
MVLGAQWLAMWFVFSPLELFVDEEASDAQPRYADIWSSFRLRVEVGVSHFLVRRRHKVKTKYL